MAANYLQPPPTNLQTLAKHKQTTAFLRQTIEHGRPGTAMMGFKQRLSSTQLAQLIHYLQQVVFRRQKNVMYHSAENGWPNHDQYEAAFPFVHGTLSVQTPYEKLDPQQQYGWYLFTQRCVICHEQGDKGALSFEPYAVSFPRGNMRSNKIAKELAVDVISSATPYAKHETAPKVTELTPLEKQGEALFQANCAFCHAPDGTGRNWIGSFIQPRPRNFNDASQMQKFDRQSLEQAILEGVEGTSMPAWKTVLEENQVKAIISYIAKVFYPALKKK